ncbi:conserved hypothetical protein [Altererythrobacter sp. B11]|uniref:host-nuclease inhibitor Gam family protein n=1 Tax=Altererythrobacter sp. B11 TaxID=2060312 RepID=UPI000DC724FF|nr:host-nuclease inhibitor Gam family protein [Altererythrobacter sp. B11]BBC72909.1 conserved hypothetical protein [Altererythrobacter sp. B11]
MAAVRAPRSVGAATKLCERFAVLEAAIADIEAERNKAIADANAVADSQAQGLIEEREQIREKMAPWWAANAAGLTEGKRKSIELGGCNLGTRSGRASLAVAGDEAAIAQKLAKRAWAAGLTRIKHSLDRAAILKVIAGEHRRQLAGLGLSRKDGEELFFLERAEQAGTLAGS